MRTPTSVLVPFGLLILMAIGTAQASQSFRRSTAPGQSAGSRIQAQNPGKNVSSETIDTISQDEGDTQLASQFKECGMSCKYQAGVAVMSVQMDYLSGLQKALSNAKDDSERRLLLKSFCLPAAQESLSMCVNRFSLFVARAQIKLARSIAEGNEAIHNLKSDVPTIGRDKQSQEEENAKKAAVTYAPKLESLQEAAKDIDWYRYLASQEFQNEMSGLLQPEPSPDDFVMMVPAKKAPGSTQPPAMVVKRKPDGSAELDANAYAAAKKAYDEWRGKAAPKLAPLWNAKSPEYANEVVRNQNAFQASVEGFIKTKVTPNSPDARERAYQTSHDSAVASINDKTGGDGAKRAVAGAQAAGPVGGAEVIDRGREAKAASVVYNPAHVYADGQRTYEQVATQLGLSPRSTQIATPPAVTMPVDNPSHQAIESAIGKD